MATRYTEITAGGRWYRLDRQAQAVFKEKTELHPVTPQNLRLLELFVSQSQHTLITKSILYDHLYGNASVTADAVSLAVKSLRKALGPGFITTDHGKGYRMVADIRHFEGSSPPPTVEEMAPEVPSTPRVPLAVWERRAKLAEEVLALCYKARDVLHKSCVHAFVHFRIETKNANVDETQSIVKACCHFEIALRMDRDLFDNIEAITFLAMTTFDSQTINNLKALNSIYWSLILSCSTIQHDSTAYTSEPTIRNIMSVEPNEAEPKAVRTKVDGAIAEIEKILRPILEGQAL